MLGTIRNRMLLLGLIFFTVLGDGLSQLEGDSCRLRGSTSGVCLKLQECESARVALLEGVTPQLCSGSGLSTLVCCSQPMPPVETISVRKCRDYTQAAWKKEKRPVLLLDDSGEDSNYNTRKCGLQGTTPLIIGGTQAQPKEFPHMASIGFGEKNDSIIWVCGGTLISERFVLTAAHCMKDPNGPDGARWVLLGDLSLDEDAPAPSRQLVAVAERIAHPQYRHPLKYHDIALLRLERAVRLDHYIRPACLHTGASISAGKAIASGWGRASDDQPISMELMKVKLIIQPSIKCQKTFNVTAFRSLRTTLPRGILEETMLCAGELEGGKDTCQGDSGGPLQLPMDEHNCMYSIIGVTSFGRLCARPNNPAVYTRVSYYVPWIESIVWKDIEST